MFLILHLLIFQDKEDIQRTKWLCNKGTHAERQGDILKRYHNCYLYLSAKHNLELPEKRFSMMDLVHLVGLCMFLNRIILIMLIDVGSQLTKIGAILYT